MAEQSALVLTAAASVTLRDVATAAEAVGVAATSVSVVTSSASATLEGAGTYDVVVSVGDKSGHHDAAFLGGVAKLLKAGGRLVVQEPPSWEDVESKALKSAVLLAGLGEASTQDVPFRGVTNALMVAFGATKPEWTGAKASIKLGKKKADAPAAASKWTVNAAEDDEELMDDDDLLTEADKTAAPPTYDDCEVGKSGKKACKNCTCGRAEEEEAGKKSVLTKEMIDNPQSGCGSCGLGDAFRCGSCPYKGLPSFEMGKKIELPAGMLVDDFIES